MMRLAKYVLTGLGFGVVIPLAAGFLRTPGMTYEALLAQMAVASIAAVATALVASRYG